MKTITKSFPANSMATDPVTGVSYTSQYDIFTIGAGYLDVWTALNNCDVAAGSARSPTASYNTTASQVSLTFASSAVWNTNIIWGSNVVWGSNVFLNARNAIWGSNVVWGSSTTTGFNAIWGANAIWGSTSQTGSESASVAINGEN